MKIWVILRTCEPEDRPTPLKEEWLKPGVPEVVTTSPPCQCTFPSMVYIVRRICPPGWPEGKSTVMTSNPVPSHRESARPTGCARHRHTVERKQNATTVHSGTVHRFVYGLRNSGMIRVPFPRVPKERVAVVEEHEVGHCVLNNEG